MRCAVPSLPTDWRWTTALLLIALCPALLLVVQSNAALRSPLALARSSLLAALLIYSVHLALLYWLLQESSLLLPLLVLVIANALAFLRATTAR